MSKQIRIAPHKLTHSYTSFLHCQQIFMKNFVTWTKTFLVMWTFYIATKVILKDFNIFSIAQTN